MQTRKQSITESIIDTGIGFIISLLLAFIINWMHDIDIPIWKNFTMTICFSVIGLIRRYIIRRYYNKKEEIMLTRAEVKISCDTIEKTKGTFDDDYFYRELARKLVSEMPIDDLKKLINFNKIDEHEINHKFILYKAKVHIK
jgi:hypothetical protein